MNRSSDSNEAFKANAILCVNTLAAAQEPLSAIFAGFTPHTMPERFAQADWVVLATGAPVLAEAVVSFDCRIAQVAEVGTHNVFFCEVDAIQVSEVHEGLIYFGRSYHRITVAA